MSRHRVSFAGCGTVGNGNTAVGLALLLAGTTLGPETVAAQGRLEARATVISASAAREGLALSDSVGRIDFAGDTLTSRRRIDGPLTSLFWYPVEVRVEGRLTPANRSSRAGLMRVTRPPAPRVARVLEIHYLRN